MIVKKLKKGFKMYASKSFNGQKILDYTKKQEKKYKKKCIKENLNWFGNLKEAKIYKTSKNHIYRWKIKKDTNLIKINKKNEDIFSIFFINTSKKLDITILLNKEKLKKSKKLILENKIECPYLDLSHNEKAYFEFQFVFGYMKLKDQVEFLKLCKCLIENNIINIKRRDDHSILSKLNNKINYYLLNPFKQKYLKINNRLSFYAFDKNVCNNICRIIPSKYKIDGIFIPNTKSFWYINTSFYKRSILEYILFYPHKNLNYDKMIM